MLQCCNPRCSYSNAQFNLCISFSHPEPSSSSISTTLCTCRAGCLCIDEFNVRSAIGLPFTANGAFRVNEKPLVSFLDDPSGCSSICPNGTSASNPLDSVVWPGATGPAAEAASSLAFFSLNCLYVVVFGITSARKSRLSMRATALACADQHPHVAVVENKPRPTKVLVLNIPTWFPLSLDDVMGLLGQVSDEVFLGVIY